MSFVSNPKPLTVAPANSAASASPTSRAAAKFNIDGVSASGDIGSVTTISKANVNLVGVSGTGEVGKVLIWSLIDDTQTKNYANINTDQSSSFAEINETQTPNWEEVA